MNSAILDRYRCPEQVLKSGLISPLSDGNRFFHFGTNLTCYGRCCRTRPSRSRKDAPIDLAQDVIVDGTDLLLPFEPTQVIESLRLERYVRDRDGTRTPISWPKDLYYFFRPFLPVSLRRQLQRIYFHSWDRIPFPQWPVDVTVDELMERLLLLFMKAAGIDELPFIWFWPDGAASAAMMTHDVETADGRDFCAALMDIDEAFGITSSFQIVPEKRYRVSPAFLNDIRSRGHEINIQDLNHDGRLFENRACFESRVELINRYGRTFGAHGFRSAVLYRNPDWFDMLEFEYDMSMPTVGHLEAQRGGCCTVFPYFIGGVLELPVTTTQDYTLFYILRQYNLDLWKAQANAVIQKHGLIHFITHPDYLSAMRPRTVYQGLLSYLCECRSQGALWITRGYEINKWWRLRSQMRLVSRNGNWMIEGPGSEHATVAYARGVGDKLVYYHEAASSLGGRTPNRSRVSVPQL
jgi:hypothetical protein